MRFKAVELPFCTWALAFKARTNLEYRSGLSGQLQATIGYLENVGCQRIQPGILNQISDQTNNSRTAGD